MYIFTILKDADNFKLLAYVLNVIMIQDLPIVIEVLKVIYMSTILYTACYRQKEKMNLVIIKEIRLSKILPIDFLLC